MTSVADQLAARIRERSRHDPSVYQKPSCVLWTDRERLWEPVIPQIQARLPGLLVLGEYAPLERRGPALWLRALLDGALVVDQATGSLFGEIPVVYVPGWSRADLRAIASCPEELRFIAEFQYRGALFAHPNGRDWTPFAFLSASKIRGGLGLDLASDGETKESLGLALGELLEEDIEQVEHRRINAEYLRGLIGTDFNRQVLDWLESPNGKPAAWTDAMMSAIESTCQVC